MKTITKENFKESVVKGISVIKFFRATGCGNCEKMKSVFESFATNNPEVACYEIDADNNKELVSSFAPQKQWSLPLIMFFEDNLPLVHTTGIVSEQKLKESLNLAQQPLELLKVAAYDLAQNINSIEVMKNNLALLDNIIIKKTSQKKEVSVAHNIPADPAELQNDCPGCE